MIFVLGYDPGSVHRWAALIKYETDKPELVAVYQVPESREGVAAVILQATLRAKGGTFIVAVERPKGIAYGHGEAKLKGKSKNLLETMNAAERFACLAWARNCRVIEYTAGQVRAAMCSNKSASDAMVRAVVHANIVGRVDEGDEHAIDAQAIAIFVLATVARYRIVHTVELVKARAKRAAKPRAKKAAKGSASKLPASVQKRMREQGLL